MFTRSKTKNRESVNAAELNIVKELPEDSIAIFTNNVVDNTENMSINQKYSCISGKLRYHFIAVGIVKINSTRANPDQ